MIERGFFSSDPAFPVLMGSQKAGLIDAAESFNDSYKVLQASSSSAAAEAVKKLAQRFAAGSGELAELVRKDQDLAVEADRLDKTLVAAVSKAPNERNPAAEEEMRKRLAEISAERQKLSDVLAERFPDYVALANPKPLTLQETQDLLADDEAVVAFNIGEKKSYAWVVTKTAADWTEIPIDAKSLDEEVQKLRQSLTFETDEPFDAALSYAVYQQTFGPIADKLAGKTRLSVFANGALTSLPFGILVASDPQGKKLKDDDWLIRSYAVTILPSIYSLKTMRAQAASTAPKPMIAFADPVFSKEAHAEAKAQHVAMRSLSSFYRGSELDVTSLAEDLPQLPGTRTEVEAIAKSLGVGNGDIKLGLDATETAVKQSKLDDYHIVYFATHGLVAGDLQGFTKAKAEPALVFTIPQKPTDLDDGLLQASEVAELKLDADWVVLSACNTASSDGVGAEILIRPCPRLPLCRRKVSRRIALGCQRRGHGKADVQPVRDIQEQARSVPRRDDATGLFKSPRLRYHRRGSPPPRLGTLRRRRRASKGALNPFSVFVVASPQIKVICPEKWATDHLNHTCS